MSKQRKELNAIYKKYKLNRNVHVFESDDYTIISRQGILNIINQEGIQLKYDLVHCASGEAVVKVSGYFEGIEYQTFGEASPMNNTFKFPVAIAEKRGQSRIVLMMVMKDFSDQVMGKDEIEHQPTKIAFTATAKGENAIESTLAELKKKRK